MAVHINDHKLEERLLEADTPICIMFFAYESKLCTDLMHELDTVEEHLKDKMEFYKINAFENPQTTAELEVDLVPTVLIYRDGDEIARYCGMHSSATLMTRFTEALNKKK